MEGGLFLVFVIIAMIARAIEAMAKGKQPPEQERPLPRPRPQPRSLPQQRAPRSGHEDEYGPRSSPYARDEVPPDATEDAAAAMIPDDLWEILTGRPKPQQSGPMPAPRQTPAPVSMQEYDEAGPDEEIGAYDVIVDEVAEYEQRRRSEEERRARERRALRERRLRERDMNTADKAPKVYSLEKPLPPAVARHAAFHAKIDAPPAAPKRKRITPRERLFTGNDMQRAIVLQEVLGKPKGLE